MYARETRGPPPTRASAPSSPLRIKEPDHNSVPRWKKNRVRISMSSPREMAGPSRFCRSVLVYTFHVVLCPFFSPPSPSSTFLYISSGLPPSIRQPRSRAQRPHWIYRFVRRRETDGPAISHAQHRMSLLHSTERSAKTFCILRRFLFHSLDAPQTSRTRPTRVDLHCFLCGCRLQLLLFVSCESPCASYWKFSLPFWSNDVIKFRINYTLYPNNIVIIYNNKIIIFT